jgi:hypothetical protein
MLPRARPSGRGRHSVEAFSGPLPAQSGLGSFGVPGLQRREGRGVGERVAKRAQGCDGTSGIRGLSPLAATPSRRDRPGLSVAPATLTSGVPETPTEILRPALEGRAGRKVRKSFCFFFFRKRRSCLPFHHPDRSEARVLHCAQDAEGARGRRHAPAARISASCRCWFSAAGRRRRIWAP